MANNELMQERLDKVMKESTKSEEGLHNRIDVLENGIREITNKVSVKKDEAKIL